VCLEISKQDQIVGPGAVGHYPAAQEATKPMPFIVEKAAEPAPSIVKEATEFAPSGKLMRVCDLREKAF